MNGEWKGLRQIVAIVAGVLFYAAIIRIIIETVRDIHP